jgi:hypothetical protein
MKKEDSVSSLFQLQSLATLYRGGRLKSHRFKPIDLVPVRGHPDFIVTAHPLGPACENRDHCHRQKTPWK